MYPAYPRPVVVGIHCVKALIVGDTHGNTPWLRGYIYPVALTLQADVIVVLGDFGAWEHTPAGIKFLDQVNQLGVDSGIPLYWLHGNHDKYSHTVAKYEPNQRGFLVCRQFVFYIPQGHTWSWGGVTFRSFGGAYSVDKAWRIDQENSRYIRDLRKAQHKRAETGVTEVVPSTAGTLWFPEEEMTDNEMDELLAADSDRKDIILSHDKPYSAKPDWNRKDLPGCVPNQLRLERALRAHRPQWWFHGHLHYHYTDSIHGGTWGTTIIGLEPDDQAAEPGWKNRHTWALAELVDGQATVTLGREIHLDGELMNDAWSSLV